jgi:hypothetical protein
MKKNTITLLLIFVYTIVFIFLFTQMRSLSAEALEELSENNIYYWVGLVFVTGILAVFSAMFAKEKNTSSVQYSTSNTPVQPATQHAAAKGGNVSEDQSRLFAELESIVQKEKNDEERTDKLLWKLCNHFEMSQGLLYGKTAEAGIYSMIASFSYVASDESLKRLEEGEGLSGQVLLEKEPYLLREIPEGYIRVMSGLGEALPTTLLIIPCIQEGELTHLFELATLNDCSQKEFEKVVEACAYLATLINRTSHQKLQTA